MNEAERILIQKIRSNKVRETDEAFVRIYKQHYRTIEAFVKNNNGKSADAEDLFQDALIVLYRHLQNPDFQLSCAIGTYIYSICRNLWLKRLRSAKRETNLTEQHESIGIPEEQLHLLYKEHQTQTVQQSLAKLGVDCQKILLLFYFEKMRMKQIAQEMGFKNEQVAKNKKSICMKQLKKVLTPEQLN